MKGQNTINASRVKNAPTVQDADIRINIKKSIETANEDRKKQLIHKERSTEEKILTELHQGR